MVRIGCNPIIEHLRHGQSCTEIDIPFFHLTFIRPDFFIEPSIDAYIFRDAFENIHRRMRMEIHKARTYD